MGLNKIPTNTGRGPGKPGKTKSKRVLDYSSNTLYLLW